MKYLLILQGNAVVLERLTTEQRAAISAGHREFQRIAAEAGELISTAALADPSAGTVIRTRDGKRQISAGPSRQAADFMGGYYLVDVEGRERAVELADLLPDSQIDGLAVEIRPVMCG
ncbi:YciI family protein [Kribbella sp. CA-293567]|uniref:YciI family protein n=1 Tax=Kribbella sp. CA-293567 TaxID=3002436 RepID=UPI0022DE1EEA|nr:YciI family protein [Kribbella sp. CA-293567]WBQ06679.1 YciI family protein [Kribbella sp. CA-293567]